MRIVICAVGRARAGPLRTLFEDYAGRIDGTRLFGRVELREVEERRALPAPEIKSREAELLGAALPKGATVVVLDARGQAMTSEAFASRLARWRDGGVADLAFAIGGAGGLDKTMLEKANLVLSLGAMTWPHLLVR
ncbi:MAG TPA: 23S rRNA (pseudouridine(1915)-N(3))-methyltransferase RlmH, partial [Alphaproteobacteria bacterium]|nr:23S rRNA (pseudouridine(1915)-N(3))-methyltransferase RlmH [Alphaproteobacteria bacterium]